MCYGWFESMKICYFRIPLSFIDLTLVGRFRYFSIGIFGWSANFERVESFLWKVGARAVILHLLSILEKKKTKKNRGTKICTVHIFPFHPIEEKFVFISSRKRNEWLTDWFARGKEYLFYFAFTKNTFFLENQIWNGWELRSVLALFPFIQK